MPLSAGRRLGAYEIVCPLGEGGMGEVYRARDERLGREVALKVLPPDVTNEPGRLERFDREARAIASLNHPHIVTIYSTEEADGIKFLTMELVDGCTLSDLVVPKGIAVAKFIDIAVPFADALSAAHQKQITHRDLKPGNVMVSNDGRVKVLDFGLARVGGTPSGEQSMVETVVPITSPGMIVGTMPYMSPEQVEGAVIDARSDLFSMGVIFYELLTGSRPFKGASSPALMSAILRDTPESLAGRRDDLPESLIRLVERLLEKRAEDRVQTARDVFNELKHLRRQLDSDASRSSNASRPLSRSQSAHRAALSVAVLPLVPRSGGDDTRALADGLTDDITSGLSRFTYLRVISRARAEELSAGSQLFNHARYALQGSVRASGSLIRISLNLVDGETGTNIWTHTYDRDAAAGLFALQDDVASTVIASVGDHSGVLVRTIAASLADVPLDQLAIRELVFRYFEYAESFTPDAHARLRAAFEAAVVREPRNADGWAYLANLCEHEHGFGFNRRPDTLARQREAAKRAIEIDPRNPAGWTSMASVCLFARDGEGVRRSGERAIALNPYAADIIARSALFLGLTGDHEAALKLVERAFAMRPSHAGYYHFVTFGAYYERGDFERALAETRLMAMPSMPMTWLTRMAAGGQLGRPEELPAARDALRAMDPALATLDGARQAWSVWIPEGPHLDRLVDGFAKALALLDGETVQTRPSRPPSSSSGARSPISDGIQPAPSIAVLPFVDLSEKKDQDWFCDGIAEEILNALAPLPGLRVAPRASAFSFRGGIADLKAIGDKLNVRTVLEGSVRRAGDRVRITTQLSDVEQGQVIWSHRFDREMQDIFDVQDEIARAIVERLRVTLADGTNRLVETRSTSIEAYELMLKGRTFVTRRGRAILEAIPLFERAITLDPNLSEAHALLGDAHRLLGLYGIMRASEAMPRARAAIDRALAIDPNQAEALASLAIIAAVYEWDVDAMLSRSDQTLRIEPDHVRANTERALAEAFIGRPDNWQADAEAHIRKARTIDPLNAWVMAADAAVHMLSGRIEEATRLAKAAIDLDASNFTAHWYFGWGLAELGRFQDVIDASVPALEMSGRHPQMLSTLAAVHAQLGQFDAIETIRAELSWRSSTSFIGTAARATVAASAGRMKEARELLATAIDEHDPYVAFHRMFGWRPIWKDERCSALLKGTTLFASTQK